MIGKRGGDGMSFQYREDLMNTLREESAGAAECEVRVQARWDTLMSESVAWTTIEFAR
jgi:hypothetical protein